MNPGRTLVVGGGAAGLMAAARAAESGAQVTLLEKMSRTGRKIGISGKGRCNLTNSAELEDFIAHFGKNGRWLRQCFQQFFRPDLVRLFTSKKLPVVTERGGRIFPESGRALDVVAVLNDELQKRKVVVRHNAAVSALLIREGTVHGVECNGKMLECDNVILATGGKSYPRTGSSGDGYRIAANAGHTIVPPRPALVPLTTTDPLVQSMAGLDLRNIEVKLFIDKKRRQRIFGELSFTSFGLTGPLILNLSAQVVEALDRGSKVSLSLDLKPALDHDRLDKRLIRDLNRRRGEEIASILRGLLPQPMIAVCLESCALPPDIDTNTFPSRKRKQLVQWLKDFRIDVHGYRSFDEALVTAGGVSLNEIDPRTMESKLVKHLFIAGELLDLHANTGGYNLQAAFSTGWVAGASVY
ncbi:MAG: NAD(P)/FAD-dependent oxidoreductase [Desulforhopalus sp.]